MLNSFRYSRKTRPAGSDSCGCLTLHFAKHSDRILAKSLMSMLFILLDVYQDNVTGLLKSRIAKMVHMRIASNVNTKIVRLIYPFMLKKAMFNLLRSFGLTSECSYKSNTPTMTIPMKYARLR